MLTFLAEIYRRLRIQTLVQQQPSLLMKVSACLPLLNIHLKSASDFPCHHAHWEIYNILMLNWEQKHKSIQKVNQNSFGKTQRIRAFSFLTPFLFYFSDFLPVRPPGESGKIKKWNEIRIEHPQYYFLCRNFLKYLFIRKWSKCLKNTIFLFRKFPFVEHIFAIYYLF